MLVASVAAHVLQVAAIQASMSRIAKKVKVEPGTQFAALALSSKSWSNAGVFGASEKESALGGKLSPAVASTSN